MPEAKTIARNTGILFVSETLTRMLAFLLVIFMARFLGDAETGKYFFAVSYISIFQVAADFGITTLMFRDVAADRKNTKKYFSNILALKLVLLFVVLILSLIVFYMLNPSAEIMYVIFLTSLYFFLVGMIHPFNILFNSYEKLEYYAIVTVSQSVIAAVAGVFLLLSGFGLVEVLYALIFSYCISLIVAVVIARAKFLKFSLEFDVQFWKNILIKSLPFWMTGIFMIIYSAVDTLMLKLYKDYSVIGLYSVALKLVESLNFIPFVLIGAVFPAMAILHYGSNEVLSRLYNKTFYYMLVLAIPIAFGASILAERIIFFFYGGEYLGSTFALQVLIWSAALLFVNFLIGYLLNAIQKAHLFTAAAGISLIANIILNFILIPLFPSYEGAAFSLVISQFINFLILYYFAAQNSYAADLTLVLKPLIASAVMAAAVYYLGFLHLLILIPLGMLLYFSVLFLIGGIGKQEITLLKGIVNF